MNDPVKKQWRHSGAGLFRLLPPELSRRAGLSAMMVASGFADSFESSSKLLDHDLNVVLPGFGKLAHPIGLGAGFERDGTHLRALNPMGLAFAEVGSVHLTDERLGIAAVGDRPGRGIVLGGIEARHVALASWPSGGASLDLVGGRLMSAVGGSPLAINLEVPLQDGPIRAVARVLGALQRLKRLPDSKQVGQIGRPRSMGVVVLSWGLPRAEQASAAQASVIVAILEALASEAALLQGLPIWIKLAPGPGRHVFQNMVETVAELGYQGIVAGSSRNVSWPDSAVVSGAQALSATNQLLEWAWAVHKGALPMIGSGGVTNGEEAFQKILRGATAVEILTALWLRGPTAARAIRTELHAEMRRFGATCISECIGAFYAA